MKDNRSRKPLSVILTLIFVLGISTTGVFAFYDINSLEQRAEREVEELARKLGSQAQAEVDDYKEKLENKANSELRELKDKLLRDTQKEVDDLDINLTSENQKKEENQVKESNARIKQARESANKKIQEEYEKVMSEIERNGY